MDDDGLWISREKRFIGVEIGGEKFELRKSLIKLETNKIQSVKNNCKQNLY